MGYSVEGDYFEGCNCTVSCPCIYTSPATNDTCEVFFAWHIKQGQKDGVDLRGLNVALAVYSPKQMTDGGWNVALYLDDHASAEQAAALGAIFSGQAGGHLAAVAPLIGKVSGVSSAPITFERANGKHGVRVGDVLRVEVDELTGGDGQNPIVITNAPFGAVTQPLRQGRAREIRYRDAWQSDSAGTNGFITDFRYEA